MSEIDEAQKEIEEILKKHKLEIGYSVTFPIYKILPDEIELALKVIAKHGMKISFTLKHPELKP